MIIDMHVHTRVSGDSSATVEQYCRAICRYRRYHPFEGIVLTEHQVYQPDGTFREIAEQYGVLVLTGIEADTTLGHLLLYGVTDLFLRRIDIARMNLDTEEVVQAISECGGIAIPAHPFRASKWGAALREGQGSLKGIKVVEALNGANSPEENQEAKALVDANGLRGIGGSDAHYANRHWFLNAATQFDNPVRNMDDLVRELRQGRFRCIRLDNSVLGTF